MKTAEERAVELLELLEFTPANNKKQLVYVALKEQDKITRHACAKNVIMMENEFMGSLSDGVDFVSKDNAHNIIMNTRAT